MELKTRPGMYCSTYVVLIATLWVAHCSAASLQARPATKTDKALTMTAKQSSTINKISPHTTTTSSIKSGTISGAIPLAIAAKMSQRNKRDISNSIGRYEMFPDVHELFPPSVQNNADIARFQKFLMLLTQKPKNTAQIEDEFDDEFDYDDAPAIELVVGKKPGNIRSAPGLGMGPKSKMLTPNVNGNVWAAGGEEPTGAPIILHQHRMKKASISEVIPEIFLRDAATSSRTQPEPKIMRKLLARIGFSRQSRSRSQNNDGRYYSLGQYLLHE